MTADLPLTEFTFSRPTAVAEDVDRITAVCIAMQLTTYCWTMFTMSTVELN